MKKLILLLLMILPGVLLSQNFRKIDSLKNELQKAGNDSLKIEINDQLFKNYYHYDPEAAKAFYLEILKLAAKANDLNGLYKGYFGAAVYNTMKSRFDSALANFRKAHEYAVRLQDHQLLVESQLSISHIHLWKNDLAPAKATGRKSLALAEKAKDSTLIALSYKNLGEIYAIESNLDSAAFYYLQAIGLLEKSGKEQSKLGDLYAGIGEIYMNLNNPGKSGEFLNKAIRLFQKINDQDGVMFASAMMGGLHFTNDAYDSAVALLLPALDYYESVGDPYRISETNRYLGLSYLNLENRGDAEKHLSNAVDEGRKAGEPINLADALVAYGEFSVKNRDFQEARVLFSEAEKLYQEVGFIKGLIKSTDILSQLYENTGNFARSNEYLKKLIHLKDSLGQMENAAVVQDLEAKYQNEKKRHQIDLLEAQNLLREKEKARQQTIFFVSIAGALIIIAFLYFLYNARHNANKKLKELDALKSRFFANISHEFRTPLTLISGPVENRLQKTDLDPDERDELEMAHRNSQRLLILVDQLLDLSKIESGGYKLKIEPADLSNLLRTVVASFDYAARQKGIGFAAEIPESSHDHWFDKDAVQKIAGNLLSNALKYTPEQGNIDFSASFENGKVTILCKNAGYGIPEVDPKKIFHRFYQANDQAGGAGIGLALVKELTDLLRGTISVSCVPNRSVTFEVILPAVESAYKNDKIQPAEIIEASPVDETPRLFVNEAGPEEEEDERPLLLIVEDNGEIRKFIKNIMTPEYRIIEAEDGRKGIETALRRIPDLIISDIMMPEADGIELCRTLKTDERSSHIPVILLTAKAGEENELKGLETGADDYIVKPFNSQLLKVRIEKLIEGRKKLQERFRQELILKPRNISITSADEKFLAKVQEILDVHISDSGFTAEFFSKEIGMSRMQLHRKIKGLTGFSTNHFIRRQRISLAADLLANSDVNISEVGYMAGFSDPSYFAKCFKDYHGCTPGEFIHKNKKIAD